MTTAQICNFRGWENQLRKMKARKPLKLFPTLEDITKKKSRKKHAGRHHKRHRGSRR